MPDSKIKVGISVGDINSIGCELILKTFQDTRMLEFCTPVIFGSNKLITTHKRQLGLEVIFHGLNDLNKVIHNKLNIFNVWSEPIDISFGKPTAKGGEYAIKSLKSASKALRENQIDVLVTAPINKSVCHSEDFKFMGHTDYLESEFSEESLMMMISEDIKVALLTDHIPLKNIPETITKELIISKIEILNQSLKQDFRISRPKIAILGINPHAGDEGLIGKEDKEIMLPTIKMLFDDKKLVFGPFPADGFFGSGSYRKYDAVVASYHDQGLAPFKMVSFGQGVNFTAGLSKVRTSPDHGTAYELAGKGEAEVSSFRQAIFKAIDVYKNRVDYQIEIDSIKINKSKKQKPLIENLER